MTHKERLHGTECLCGGQKEANALFCRACDHAHQVVDPRDPIEEEECKKPKRHYR